MLSLTCAVSDARAAAASALPAVGPVRALVISPHPDDATLAAGGLIQRIIRDGGSVRVIQMTGGDGFPKGVTTLNPRAHPDPIAYRLYGSLREREAIHALHRLGVGRSRIRLLGFPDEGLCLLAGTAPADRPFTSPYTQREAPPASEQLIPGAMYRRDDLVRELTSLITVFHPTLIVLPHAGDEHPDHCATHLLIHQALAEAMRAGMRPPRILHYVLHYPTWPDAIAGDGLQTPPQNGHAGEWQWRSLALTPNELTTKRHALDAYRSQQLVMADFMKAFERSNELFIEGEPPAPFPCWCNGDNIAGIAIGSR